MINTPYYNHIFQRSVGVRSDTGPFTHAAQDTYVYVGNAFKSGSNNVDWKQKIARGQDATSTYVRVGYSGRPCSLLARSVTNFGFVNITAEDYVQHNIGFNMATFADDVALQDQALSRLKNRLSSNIGNFKAMAPLAELRELRGFVHEASSITGEMLKALIALKKGRVKNAVQVASKIWLNYSFAIKPLVSDIAEASHAVSSYLERNDLNLRLHGSASKSWTTSQKASGFTGTYNGSYELRAEARHTLSYRYACGVKLSLKSANNYGLDDHFGLTLRDLPSTAWELVPFSWVVDYFTTVGAYLEDTFVLPPGSTKYIYLNKRYKFELKVSGSHRVFAPSVLVFDHCTPGYGSSFYFSRVALNSLPHLSLRIKSADEVARNALNRVLNLASVLVSTRKR